MVNRKDIMKELRGIINTFLEQKSPQILALLGDYGIGKTFTLLQGKGLLLDYTPYTSVFTPNYR
jgi:DNA replication protein DnaC